MKLNRWIVVLMVLIFTVTMVYGGGQQDTTAEGEKKITLVGAAMVPEDHVYTRSMEKFGELVKEYYSGALEVEVHHSGDLGEEKDFFEYMMAGDAVDFAIISPGWIANWDDQFAFLDTPFLWRNLDHWQAGMESEVFVSLEENVRDRGVRILGYAGGGQRNLILSKEVSSVEDLPSIKMRVQGSPIQARVFNATGIQATPMDYLEVYNAIKTGVIDGLENEASSLITMKFYEVAPYIVLTNHTITIRPLCFSEKRFNSFPKELQAAIQKAGVEAAAWAREEEVSAAPEILNKLESEGKITTISFEEGAAKMRARALPVIEDYATELGVAEVYEDIKTIR